MFYCFVLDGQTCTKQCDDFCVKEGGTESCKCRLGYEVSTSDKAKCEGKIKSRKN